MADGDMQQVAWKASLSILLASSEKDGISIP
jgi:hypothetical protein